MTCQPVGARELNQCLFIETSGVLVVDVFECGRLAKTRHGQQPGQLGVVPVGLLFIMYL
jgi:hypothetical protein